MAAKPEDFARIYERFQAPIARFDCGRKCAPLNGGEPVCCSAKNAVPLVLKTEYRLLRSRSDLWHRFTPYDGASRKIVEGLHHTCVAIECKGVAFCERENRSMACRAFPFYPYITRDGAFAGLAYYWDFEHSCWVISNLEIVDPAFVREFVRAHEMLFEVDRDEYETFKLQSANMRRVFSRRKAIIPLIGRDGGYFKVLPKSGRIVPADPKRFPKHGPFKSARAFAKAVKEAEAAAQDLTVEFLPSASL
ncbi:MAG TPA: hypothetical protein VLV76_04715 [Candidatus Acidoferrum sp.]|nr:hypothetical protein [Candidatus Acidoferrum sp.]